VPEAHVLIEQNKTQTDSLGHYTIENIAQGHYKIQITATGFET
jgi:outer membrane receptor for ferrienterochelin and colicins